MHFGFCHVTFGLALPPLSPPLPEALQITHWQLCRSHCSSRYFFPGLGSVPKLPTHRPTSLTWLSNATIICSTVRAGRPSYRERCKLAYNLAIHVPDAFDVSPTRRCDPEVDAGLVGEPTSATASALLTSPVLLCLSCTAVDIERHVNLYYTTY